MLGPAWVAAYPHPETEDDHLAALERAGNAALAERLRWLFSQLRAQGARVELNATVRARQRGYLIYGAYILSRCDTARCVRRSVRRLKRINRRFDLAVSIRWRHPRGWRATVRAAKRMAEAFDVVHATYRGALYSDHYDGAAVDFEATHLPRELVLVSADRSRRQAFDLSAPDHPRDLSLTPELIEWVEEAFDLEKLERD